MANSTLGFRTHWHFISAAAYPKIIYQQNKAYDYPRSQFAANSEYGNPFMLYFDLPERMGPSSFSTFNLGDLSTLRAVPGMPVFQMTISGWAQDKSIP
jgi:hypothetical protein